MRGFESVHLILSKELQVLCYCYLKHLFAWRVSTETQTLQEVRCLPSLQMEDVSLDTPQIQASPEGSHAGLLSLTSCVRASSNSREYRKVWGRLRCSEGGKGARVWVRTQPGKARKGGVGRHWDCIETKNCLMRKQSCGLENGT